MRAIFVFVAVLLTSMPCAAVDFRWSHFVFHGEEHARIANKDDSALDIWCSIYKQDAKRAGMDVELTTAKSVIPKFDTPTAQIVIDDANYPFTLQGTIIVIENTADAQIFKALINAFIKARAKTFSVEFPKYNIAEGFSLLSARNALTKGRRTIIDGCNFFP